MAVHQVPVIVLVARVLALVPVVTVVVAVVRVVHMIVTMHWVVVVDGLGHVDHRIHGAPVVPRRWADQ